MLYDKNLVLWEVIDLDVRNFDRFRIDGSGSTYMDVSRLNEKTHHLYGQFVTAYLFKSNDEDHVVEVRKKDRQIALFNMAYSDLDIPEYWKDAEVIFRWSEKDNEY